MSDKATPNPDDLRFDYEPFEKPIQTRIVNSAGQDMGWTHRGRMRVVWDSPRGPFYMAWAVEDDMTEHYETEPTLRQQVAQDLKVAFDEDHASAAGSVLVDGGSERGTAPARKQPASSPDKAAFDEDRDG